MISHKNLDSHKLTRLPGILFEYAFFPPFQAFIIGHAVHRCKDHSEIHGDYQKKTLGEVSGRSLYSI